MIPFQTLLSTGPAILFSIMAVVILFLLYLFFAVIIVYVMNRQVILIRGEDPKNPCCLQFSDYEDVMERTPYQCSYYGKAINGYIYQEKGREDFKGFILLAHGLFGTHVQYLVDIRYLTKLGYQVLAYDQFGCGLSEGENQESLATGIYVMENVIRDVEKRNVNHDLPLILYGHSWGAYSSCGALKNHPEISKAILRSGFVSPIQVSYELLRSQKKALACFIKPVFSLAMTLYFSPRYVAKSTRGFHNQKTKILVIQSEDDTSVSMRASIANYLMKHPKNNAEVFLTKTGGHNTIITEEGTKNYLNAIREYESIEANSEEEKNRKREEFASGLRRVEMYPYREDVTTKIQEFLEN